MPSSRAIAGLAVIAVGFLLVGGIFGLALAPSQFYWTKVYPNGTQSSPLELTAGIPVQLNVEVMFTGGPLPQYWAVSTTIVCDGEVLDRVDLGAVKGTDTMPVYDEITRTKTTFMFAWWDTSWTPPTPGKTYRFEWYASIKDSAGTLVKTQSTVSYAKTQAVDEPPLEPDGVFYVAGWKLDPSRTALNVTKPQVQLNFVATKAASNIEKTHVEIKNRTSGKSSDVTIPSGGASYALPDYGLYDVKCYIDWVGGDPLYKAGVALNYPAPPPVIDDDDDGGGDDGTGDEDGDGDGDGEVPGGTFLEIGRFLGIGLIAFGAIILFSGRRRR